MSETVLPPPRAYRPATIHDVAAEAQVAVGTVSRYLNGKPIREGNRLKVDAAVRKLSFVRNVAAATIRSDASRLVGFLVSSYDQFQTEVLTMLTSRLQAQGRLLLPIPHDGSAALVQRALRFFAEHRIDVLIASGDFPELKQLQTIAALNTRIVLFNNDVPGLVADRIMFNDARGMGAATHRLISLGHRRIGLVAGFPGHTGAVNRLEGYRAALAEAGIGYDPDLVVGHSWMERDGYFGTAQLLALATPPTALVTANYLSAMGALRLLNERSIRVPEDMSVIVYGDADFLPLISGGIDAVILPTERLVDAMDYICRSGGKLAQQTILLECDLLVRGSTRRRPEVLDAGHPTRVSGGA